MKLNSDNDNIFLNNKIINHYNNNNSNNNNNNVDMDMDMDMEDLDVSEGTGAHQNEPNENFQAVHAASSLQKANELKVINLCI